MDAQSTCLDSVSKERGDKLDYGPLSRNAILRDQLGKGLGYVPTESLCVEDIKESPVLGTSRIVVGGDRFVHIMNGEIIYDNRPLSKCATFPCSDKSFHSDIAINVAEKVKLEGNQHQLGMNPASTRSTSLPSLPCPTKLVSAMKGGREKKGIPPPKLSVSWTPDVYDPAPTIASHTVRNKKQHKSGKKKGKNKEKTTSKGSRSGGSSSKDKKLHRRTSGGSDKCYRSMDIIPARSTNPDNHSDAFTLGSPDSYCGGSYLKESLLRVHMPVAEAL